MLTSSNRLKLFKVVKFGLLNQSSSFQFIFNAKRVISIGFLLLLFNFNHIVFHIVNLIECLKVIKLSHYNHI